LTSRFVRSCARDSTAAGYHAVRRRA
jgi:hypothetical protein